MRILNIMFGRGKGGLEQAFLDYNDMLKQHFDDVIALYHKDAFIVDALKKQNIRAHAFSMLGTWDPIAALKLRLFLFATEPDVIITHGNRALQLVNKANRKNIPVMAVAHKYSTKHFKPHYTGIAITKDIEKNLKEAGIHRTELVPNGLRLDPNRNRLEISYNTPPIIGAMGRFVDDKGFKYYIEALALLKEEGFAFEAILGGQGPLEKELKSMAKSLGLNDHLHFPGWIQNKKYFFEDIDIFCIPSVHEPFGIVVLEGMQAQVPMVIANSEGPSEIITPNHDAILVHKSNAYALTQGLKKLLIDQEFAQNLVDNAYKTLEEKYSFNITSLMLKDAIEATLRPQKSMEEAV